MRPSKPVGHPTILGWLNGAIPDLPMQRRIAKWTGDGVPLSSWVPRGTLADVKPFRRGRRAA